MYVLLYSFFILFFLEKKTVFAVIDEENGRSNVLINIDGKG